jgi:lactobin A/cerein 7B family class IIb bacteriocin
MKELQTKDFADVNGGVAPLVLVGYFVGGVVTGGGAAAGAIWVAKQLKAL